jgi:adenylate kinase
MVSRHINTGDALSNGKTCFVGGVPGSGKTFWCEGLVERVPHVRHVGAGQLIRRALDGETNQYVRPPVEDDARGRYFQDLLVTEFEVERSRHPGHLLLDGHFVIPTGVGLVEVAPEVFRRLRVDMVVLQDADPERVYERLLERPRPAWWDGSRESVSAYIERERKHAKVVAAYLGLGLLPPAVAARQLEGG